MYSEQKRLAQQMLDERQQMHSERLKLESMEQGLKETHDTSHAAEMRVCAKKKWCRCAKLNKIQVSVENEALSQHITAQKKLIDEQKRQLDEQLRRCDAEQQGIRQTRDRLTTEEQQLTMAANKLRQRSQEVEH